MADLMHMRLMAVEAALRGLLNATGKDRKVAQDVAVLVLNENKSYEDAVLMAESFADGRARRAFYEGAGEPDPEAEAPAEEADTDDESEDDEPEADKSEDEPKAKASRKRAVART